MKIVKKRNLLLAITQFLFSLMMGILGGGILGALYSLEWEVIGLGVANQIVYLLPSIFLYVLFGYVWSPVKYLKHIGYLLPFVIILVLFGMDLSIPYLKNLLDTGTISKEIHQHLPLLLLYFYLSGILHSYVYLLMVDYYFIYEEDGNVW